MGNCYVNEKNEFYSLSEWFAAVSRSAEFFLWGNMPKRMHFDWNIIAVAFQIKQFYQALCQKHQNQNEHTTTTTNPPVGILLRHMTMTVVQILVLSKSACVRMHLAAFTINDSLQNKLVDHISTNGFNR